MNEQPVVSILCVTFNQRSYIGNALDSFLMQETTFPYEILIYDDASTDGTQDVIKEYAVAHDNIRPFLSEKNRYDEYPVGGYFQADLEPIARGKYIALCEGDDYWTNPKKLQRQFDFMESNPGYTCCGHAYRILNAQSDEIEPTIIGYGEEPLDLTPEMILTNLKMQTATLFYRRGLGPQYIKDWYPDFIVGDFPWLIYLCQKGKVRYLPEPMSVYRRNAAGSYSMESDIKELEERNILLVKECETIDRLTDHAYHEELLARERSYAFLSFLYGSSRKETSEKIGNSWWGMLTMKQRMHLRAVYFWHTIKKRLR